MLNFIKNQANKLTNHFVLDELSLKICRRKSKNKFYVGPLVIYFITYHLIKAHKKLLKN